MAHRSWVSPDRKWVLISEMDQTGFWLPCFVTALNGGGERKAVGPKNSRCTHAAWSPDGKTMYFSADAGDGYHIWRQNFPHGAPEQLTFGTTEEEGLAISPEGRSLVTSAGIRLDSVWIHDSRGDRQVSGEGSARIPGLGYASNCGHSEFSPDGKQLFYLVSPQGSRDINPTELNHTELDSEHSESVLPGVAMRDFDLSPDGERVAYDSQDSQGEWNIWLASLDRNRPPIQLTSNETYKPCFGASGTVYFQVREGNKEFVYAKAPKDSEPRRVSPRDLHSFSGISPHEDILLFGFSPLMALSQTSGAVRPICKFCSAGWGLGGRFFYIRFREAGEIGGGKAVAFALKQGHDLPDLPASGLNSLNDLGKLKVAATIDTNGIDVLNPGPEPGVYTFTRTTVQRNLVRIPIDR